MVLTQCGMVWHRVPMQQQAIYLDDELAKRWATAVPAKFRSVIVRAFIRAYLRQMDTPEGLAIFREAAGEGGRLTITVNPEKGEPRE
jgi:hypothetical protein